jgi:hypothetical protein
MNGNDTLRAQVDRTSSGATPTRVRCCRRDWLHQLRAAAPQVSRVSRSLDARTRTMLCEIDMPNPPEGAPEARTP